jgi:hypothetical protein
MIRDTGWFKSSRSAGASDQCVEVRIQAGHPVGIRDSKNPTAATLWLPTTTWRSFLTHTTTDAFDQLGQ